MRIRSKHCQIERLVSFAEFDKGFLCIFKKLLVLISPPDIIAAREMSALLCPDKIPEFKITVILEIEFSSSKYRGRSDKEDLPVFLFLQDVTESCYRRIEGLLCIHLVSFDATGLKRKSGSR